jgi:hypothetical protein
MARHRQKDEEIGVEGCGILNTRKRMWVRAHRERHGHVSSILTANRKTPKAIL